MYVKKSYIVISGFYFLDYDSHSGHAPTMTISDPSMNYNWENLQNIRVFKYLFSLTVSHHFILVLIYCINMLYVI